MTAALTFYWSRDPASRQSRWQLYDQPPGSPRWPIGSCSAFGVPEFGERRWWRASIFGGGGRCFESVWAEAGSSKGARAALEREVARRSIGLFNVDDVAFVTL